ncbi:MAG: hypothetical protein U0169_26270 [Polyangiaceae bacterium]
MTAIPVLPRTTRLVLVTSSVGWLLVACRSEPSLGDASPRSTTVATTATTMVATTATGTSDLPLPVPPKRGTAKGKTPCGSSPNDWCDAPVGDPCGAHTDVASCRADARCKGMRYTGESVVACKDDGTGFASNCPTVGCVSR